MKHLNSENETVTVPKSRDEMVDYIIEHAEMQPSIQIDQSIDSSITKGLSEEARKRFQMAANVFDYDD